MAAQDDRKAELITRLTQARLDMQSQFGGLRRAADIPARVRRSYKRHQWNWIGGATLFGILMSLLPARTKKGKVKVARGGSDEPAKQTLAAGLVFAALKFALDLFRPYASAWLTQRLVGFAGNRGGRR